MLIQQVESQTYEPAGSHKSAVPRLSCSLLIFFPSTCYLMAAHHKNTWGQSMCSVCDIKSDNSATVASHEQLKTSERGSSHHLCIPLNWILQCPRIHWEAAGYAFNIILYVSAFTRCCNEAVAGCSRFLLYSWFPQGSEMIHSTSATLSWPSVLTLYCSECMFDYN